MSKSDSWRALANISMNQALEPESTLDSLLDFDSKRNLLEWKGNLESLLQFCSKSLNMKMDSMYSSCNRSKTIKSKWISSTFFVNTGTLHAQGTEAKRINDFL